jgi:predicted nucleotidyltransferase
VSIADRFQSLIRRIQPTPAELTAKYRHAAEIESCLKSARGINGVRRIGSYSRDSAVHGISDLDLLAVFTRESARWGNGYVSGATMLGRVRDALGSRFHATDAIRDGQAVVCRFRDGDIDVVPAVFEGMRAAGGVNRPLFLIPSAAGGWMPTSPEAHDVLIKEAHAKSGRKFAACVQVLKFWRDCRTPRTPISSFHLEVLFASEGTFAGVQSYQECLVAAFRTLRRRGCCAINDPMGVSGRVPAAASDPKARLATEHAATALDKAERALAAELSRDQETAHRYWNMVFNGKFPAS